MSEEYGPGVRLRDVTLRDGLQLTGKLLPTDRKVEIVRSLLALGVPELEIGSMARPDLVAPMANSLDLIEALTPEELDRCWVWVATPRHVEKAAAAGARRFIVLDLSSHGNLQQPAQHRPRHRGQLLAAMPWPRNSPATPAGIYVIATVFYASVDGAVDRHWRPRSRPIRAPTAPRHVAAGTLGQAVPAQVRARRRVRAKARRRIVFHGHDTGPRRGEHLAAIDAGATPVDGCSAASWLPLRTRRERHASTEDLLSASGPDGSRRMCSPRCST